MQKLKLDDGQKREDGLKSPQFLNFQTKFDPRISVLATRHV
jgi:hypothetical protein